MRKSAFLFAATIIFAALAPSCSTSKDGGTGSGGARANASNTNRGGSRTDQEDTEAEKGPLAHKIRDARIVLRQARSDALFIIVNQGNAKRQTMAGRLELSYGDRGLAYKPLSEREVDALLTSLETYELNAIKQPWVSGDEQYLQGKTLEQSGYTGIIVIENDGQRHKVLGVRPMGSADPAMKVQLQRFTDLKTLVTRWYNTTSRSERPADVAEGTNDAFNPNRR